MSQDRPMVLAVLGDFGGRREPGTRRLRRVDRDTLDAVMAGLGITVEVTDGDETVSLRLERMDDFRPDSFVRRVPGLPGMLAEPEGPEQRPAPVAPEAAPAVPTGASLLDSILGSAEASPARDTIQELARRVAEPSTVRGPASRAAEPDQRLADAVRAVLYSPRFQALEAAWRGLATLVQEAETGELLRVYLLDAERDEAPLLLAEELATPGAPRPTCVLAGYTFGPAAHDLAVLERYGAVALAAGVPLVADASPAILGLDDARDLGDAYVRRRIGMGTGPEAWRAFRALPAAVNVTLVLPRVLLRAPYGSAGEQVAAFRFDEKLTGRDHERFLWGSAALAYGCVLARAFAAEGWDADIERYAESDGLPVHVWREGGEECVLPCAEVVMSDPTVGRVVEEGLMVVAGVRGTDRVMFRRGAGFSPVAD
jgi:type VI secretion system protein ImpC